LVEEVALFGNMLSEETSPSDIDVSVRLERKFEGEAFMKAVLLRTRLAIESGISFRNLTDEAYWTEHEFTLFLKNRSGAISLVRWNSD
jgi:hypothetical protein